MFRSLPKRTVITWLLGRLGPPPRPPRRHFGTMQQERARRRALGEWMKIAVEHDVPLGPAPADLPQLLDDPHMRQREIFCASEHPKAGPFTYVGQPAVIEGQSYEVWPPAPGLGEHTREVLAELGLTADQLDQLASRQMI
jgi:crotonobetainyl-CoA:carnitine CoA-transferase CaiB-like acyl-CoA transferase